MQHMAPNQLPIIRGGESVLCIMYEGLGTGKDPCSLHTGTLFTFTACIYQQQAKLTTLTFFKHWLKYIFTVLHFKYFHCVTYPSINVTFHEMY